jgi:hypothetical protein
MTTFAREDMHDLADPLETELCILGLAIPNPSVQALDLSDDYGLCLQPPWLVGGPTVRCLLCVLQPHGDVKPVCPLPVRDAAVRPPRHDRQHGGKMRSHLVQLRCRPTVGWPVDPRLGATTAGAGKAGKPDRHRAEQRRDLMQPPTLDVTPTTAGRTARSPNRMVMCVGRS